MSIQVHVPHISDDEVSSGLRRLTRELLALGGEWVGGVLGGDDGYGVEFENDVFEMHPFYWGDCECGHQDAEDAWEEAHDHDFACYQSEIARRGFSYDQPMDANTAVTRAVCVEMGLDPNFGSYVHCTCYRDAARKAWNEMNDHDPACRIILPNFRHKASGSEVVWYKYIGRSMETDVRDEWSRIMLDCLESLR